MTASGALPEPTRLGARSAALSSAQERLWYIDGAAPGSAAYNVPLLLRWRRPADPAALGAALTRLTARHEVLRTVYQVRDGQPVQLIRDPAPVHVETVESPGEPDRHDIDRRARTPFDLAQQTPLRCTLWRGVPGGDLMLLNIHHIAVDGWSLLPLFDDLAEAYRSASQGTATIGEPPLQYADYAAWEKTSGRLDRLRPRLAERAEQLLPLCGEPSFGPGRPRTTLPEGARRGAQHSFQLPAESWQATRALAARLRVTPFTVLFAAFQVLVQRWTGRDGFLLGTVAADRPLPELEPLIGFFVNTVPLRCTPDAEQSFEQLCLEARTEAFRVTSLARLPYDRLSAQLARLRSDTGPLVDIGFGLQNMPSPRDCELWSAPELLPTGSAKFGLLLLLEEEHGDNGGLRGLVEYDLDRYPPELAGLVAAQYRVLLTAALTDPAQPLHRLPLTEPRKDAPHPGVVRGALRDLVSDRLARPVVLAGGST